MRLVVICLSVVLLPEAAFSQERYPASEQSGAPLPFMDAQALPDGGAAASAPTGLPERPPARAGLPSSTSGATSAQPLAHPGNRSAAAGADVQRARNESDSAPPSPYAPDAAPPNVSPPALMGDMLTAPSDSRLAGRPTTLVQVIGAGGSRDEQTVRINAYWDLCSSVADYYLGLTEAREVQILQQRMRGLEAASAVGVAAAAVRERVAASQTAAVAAQQRLASLLGMSQTPLPADMPHCGAYDTMYDQVFASRRVPEAMNLDRLIPLRYAELRAAAEGVGRAEAWIKRVAQLQTPNSTGAGILRALELLALNRRAFVQIAKDYNRQITRYVELARPGRIEDERLVRMHLGARSSAVAAGPPRTPRASQALPPHIGAGRR